MYDGTGVVLVQCSVLYWYPRTNDVIFYYVIVIT